MEKDTEKRILQTARKHFVQNGFAGARMQEIADDAGINKAMLHYYFRSKDKLYHQVTIQVLQTIMPIIAEVMGKKETLEEKIENLVDTYIDMLIAEPDIPIFIMSELTQKRERFIEELKKNAIHFSAVQNFFTLIQIEVDAGTIRPIPPAQLILNIMSLTIFPFVAKPIYMTIFNFPEEIFENLMRERKQIILDFVKNALRPV